MHFSDFFENMAHIVADIHHNVLPIALAVELVKAELPGIWNVLKHLLPATTLLFSDFTRPWKSLRVSHLEILIVNAYRLSPNAITYRSR